MGAAFLLAWLSDGNSIEEEVIIFDRQYDVLQKKVTVFVRVIKIKP